MSGTHLPCGAISYARAKRCLRTGAPGRDASVHPRHSAPVSLHLHRHADVRRPTMDLLRPGMLLGRRQGTSGTDVTRTATRIRWVALTVPGSTSLALSTGISDTDRRTAAATRRVPVLMPRVWDQKPGALCYLPTSALGQARD
eukprot:1989664-Rhodomonas_salina.4